MRLTVYFAHPLGGDITENIANAKRWLSFLMRVEPDVCFVAPWLACVLAGADDRDPRARERGLLDAMAIVPRCDGIVLCGPAISSGMAMECEAAIEHGLRVFHLTGTRLPHQEWQVDAWPGLDVFEADLSAPEVKRG